MSKKILGLERNTFKKCVREFHDFDYIDKLSTAEQTWLGQFSDEYYGSRFHKNLEPLHSPEVRLEIYKDDYARRMDLFTFQQKQKLNEDTNE